MRNKKISKLVDPSFRLYFLVGFLFAAVTVRVSIPLAICEAAAMEDEMVEVVVESVPQLTARDVSERTEWLTREMFRAFTRNQTEIGILFSGSRQGLFINRVEAAMSKCISASDPSFDADVVRKIVLSFCVQGCYYTFTSYCGQMDEKRLVALLASIARAAQKIRM